MTVHLCAHPWYVQCPLNWGALQKSKGHSKKNSPALCAEIRAPPLSICFRRLCVEGLAMGMQHSNSANYLLVCCSRCRCIVTWRRV